MELNEKKVDLEFVDSLFEELNAKVEADAISSSDASCGGGIIETAGCSTDCKITLSW